MALAFSTRRVLTDLLQVQWFGIASHSQLNRYRPRILRRICNVIINYDTRLVLLRRWGLLVPCVFFSACALFDKGSRPVFLNHHGFDLQWHYASRAFYKWPGVRYSAVAYLSGLVDTNAE